MELRIVRYSILNKTVRYSGNKTGVVFANESASLVECVGSHSAGKSLSYTGPDKGGFLV